MGIILQTRGMPDSNKQGRKAKWFAESYDASSWNPINVGTTWERQNQEFASYDGWFWYRLDFQTPAELPSDKPTVLSLGHCDDESWVWLNGIFHGETTDKSQGLLVG